MSNSFDVEDIAPILPVGDMDRTIQFYSKFLNFEIGYVSEDKRFATLKLGPSAIYFTNDSSSSAAEKLSDGMRLYIWVRNIEGLYTALKDNLSKLPQEQHQAIFQQEYGMKEFHVTDPDGCLLMFGENMDDDA